MTLFLNPQYTLNFSYSHVYINVFFVHLFLQEWDYPREKLTYMRELGEGQFGKVLLMKAQVGGPWGEGCTVGRCVNLLLPQPLV